MNADGTGETKLTTGNHDCEPAFLPDGRVAFVRSASFCPDLGDIWMRAVNGTEDQLTSFHPAPPPDSQDFNPTSSPDGQTIAFARGDIGDSVIYTVSSTPAMPVNDAHAVSNDHGNNSFLDTSPDYSPDGSTIVFARCIGGEGCFGPLSIFSVGAQGDPPPTQLTDSVGGDNPPDDCEPAYSPDGSTVVFSHFEANSNCNFGNAQSALGFTGSPMDVRAQVPRVAVQPSGIGGFRPNWQPAVAPAATPPGGGGGSAGTGTLGAAASVRGKCFHTALTIRGTRASEKIVGTPGDDVIHGFKGDDRIIGRGGKDILCGGRGEDRIFGKGQNDILIGGDGSDYLKGGPGVNRIFGGTPNAPDEKANNVCVTGPSDTEQNCQHVR